ncbi:MAG TPA: PAS domain S-box protein [Candidatus Acidoferrales bacterium]|jgi:PAS domain S-box-containing protein|nr:PAS domain S-box protein [Candidatus Acidoferrales bacterium]
MSVNEQCELQSEVAGAQEKRGSSSSRAAEEKADSKPLVAGDCRTLIDLDRRYVYVSDEFCKLVGYSREELIGTRYDELSAPDTNDLRTVFNLFCQLEYMHGLWMFLARGGNRILVRYESWLRPDLLIEAHMQVVAE